MEHFDYLTYKQNKNEEKQQIKKYTKEEKMLALGIWAGTFAVVFVLAILFIASRTSKIDIEYGRLGKDTEKGSLVGLQEEENGEEITRKERFTVDKRLFLIQQEEKGPSKSKMVGKSQDQSEVISTNTFNEIKTKNSELAKKNTEENKEIKQESTLNPTNPTKAIIKPKLPVSEQNTSSVNVQPLGALDVPKLTSKVLIGKYPTIEEVRKVQNSLPEPTFVKKINNYYTLQVGSYESSEVAKSVASKLKMQGYNTWILQ